MSWDQGSRLAVPEAIHSSRFRSEGPGPYGTRSTWDQGVCSSGRYEQDYEIGDRRSKTPLYVLIYFFHCPLCPTPSRTHAAVPQERVKQVAEDNARLKLHVSFVFLLVLC